MKHPLYLLTAAIALIFGGALQVHATVGGPSYIYDFKYNPADESVYYIQNSQSGRGCPPILMKISLNSGKYETVLSCDQGEVLLQSSASGVNRKIEEITKNFKALTPLNLPKNNIAVDVDFLRTETISPEDSWVIKSHFTAEVLQNKKAVTEFPITGCTREQPFTFAGYAIPGFDKKIMLLLSAKGDCWEGGYTYESLHVIGGVDKLDKTNAGDYKWNQPLVPSEATLVVFEKDIPAVTAPAPEPDRTDWSQKGGGYSKEILLSIAIAALILGGIAGAIFGRRK